MTFYTTIAALISTFLSTYLTDKLKGKILLKAIIVALIVGFFVLSVSYYENVVLKKKSKPILNVKTFISDNILSIKLTNDKPDLEKAILEFHIPGHITEVERIHPVADAESQVYVEGEQTSEYLTNRLELIVENAKPNFELHFNAYFKSLSWPRINFVDRDLYCVTQIWKFKDEKHYTTEWRSLRNDVAVSVPRARLGAIRMKGDLKEGEMVFSIKILRKAKPFELDSPLVWLEDREMAAPKINPESFGPIKRKEI